jgi:acetolactate synthase-1/2/3 large subunit
MLNADVEYKWPEKIGSRLPPDHHGHNRQVTEAVSRPSRRRCSAWAAAIKANAIEAPPARELAGCWSSRPGGARRLPDSHELCAAAGMHGVYTAVTAMQRADLLVALGARFDDRVTGKLSRSRRGQDRARRHRPAEIGRTGVADVIAATADR